MLSAARASAEKALAREGDCSLTSNASAMIETRHRRRRAVATALRVLVLIEAVVLLLAALLHLRVQISVGAAVLVHPRIVPLVSAPGSDTARHTVASMSRALLTLEVRR
jgi:hypothetical protein